MLCFDRKTRLPSEERGWHGGYSDVGVWGGINSLWNEDYTCKVGIFMIVLFSYTSFASKGK